MVNVYPAKNPYFKTLHKKDVSKILRIMVLTGFNL